MGAVKHSRQRDAIKTFLMSRKDHPTADVVYTFVKNDFPSISLGTVYRNLSFLVEHGEAVTVPCEDGFVHYDEREYNLDLVTTAPGVVYKVHKTDGTVIDITNPSDNEILENLGANVSSHFPGKIEAGSVCFYGLCEKCALEN